MATDTYAVRPGDAVVVHAAAGGVARLLTQIVKLRRRGARWPSAAFTALESRRTTGKLLLVR